MKKLIVLVMLLMAVGLWAQDLSITGMIGYMFAQDLMAGKEFSDKPQYELKFNFNVDDYNTAYLEIEENPMELRTGPGFTTADISNAGNGLAILDKAYWTTDVGAALGLPVGVTFKVGAEEWKNKDAIKVTKSEWEDNLGKSFKTWGGQVEIMPADMITIRSNWTWNADPKYFLIGAYGTVAPVTYELTYSTNGQEFDKGWLEGGAEFNQDVTSDINVGVAVLGEYDLQDLGTVANPTWQVQAGAQALYKSMASLGVAWRGQDQATAGGLQLQVWAAPIADKPLELYALVGLGLDDAKYPESFDSMEISLKYSFGSAEYWLGYFYAPAGSQGIAKEALDEDVAGVAGKGAGPSDTGAIWFRGKISL
jgi:hypothetical protein